MTRCRFEESIIAWAPIQFNVYEMLFIAKDNLINQSRSGKDKIVNYKLAKFGACVP